MTPSSLCASLCLPRARRRAGASARWLAALAAWALATQVFAANVCALPGVLEDGIGGTGSPVTHEGMGGSATPTIQDGVGGTGAPIVQEGLGGTGAPQEGIGGTGIVGVITGFGSVCVNGAEVHYDESTAVTLDGEPVSAARLGVGQVARVVARTQARGLVARSIAIEHAVVGPLGRLDASRGRLHVLGQAVRFAPEAVRDGAGRPAAAESLRGARVVQVSGLRTPQGELLATRIEPAAAGTRASASGTITRIAEGRAAIGAMEIDIGALAEPARLVAGQQVVLIGRAVSGRLRAESAREAQTLERSRVERIVAQGVVARRGPRAIEVSGLPQTELDAGTRIRGDNLAPGAVVRIDAVRDRHGWRARQIDVQAERDLHTRAGREHPTGRGELDKRGGEPSRPGREEGDEDRSGSRGRDEGSSGRDAGSGTSGRDSGDGRDTRSGRDSDGGRDSRSARDGARTERSGSSSGGDRIERQDRGERSGRH